MAAAALVLRTQGLAPYHPTPEDIGVVCSHPEQAALRALERGPPATWWQQAQ